MKSVKLLLILVFLTLASLAYAQEITVGDSVDNTFITGSVVGMYQGTKSKKAQEYFDKAVEYGDKQDNQNAEKFYLKALKQDAGFVEAYDNLGIIYRKTNQLDKAIESYTKSIDLYPKGTTAHQNLATVYRLQKKYEKAIEEYNQIIKIDSKNPEGYFGLANTYIHLSKFDTAIENAKKALKIYEETESVYLSDAYSTLGFINYYKGDKEQAKHYFQIVKERGAEIHPQIEKELFTQENTAYSLETKEDYAESEEEVIKAYDWLLKTPLGTKTENRRSVNAFLIKWLTGSPNVSIVLSDKIVTYVDCGECLAIFMGAWAKYSLESRDFKNKFQGNLAGTQGVIEFYLKNKKVLGKNKSIEKLIKLKDKNKLRNFIKSNI